MRASSPSCRLLLGLSGLCVFTFGTLFAPLAHNLQHQDDHVHEGELGLASERPLAVDAHDDDHDHCRPEGHDEDHCAPDGDDDHDHGVLDGDDEHDHHAVDGHADHHHRHRPDPGHGSGSLLHFAAAVLTSAPLVVPHRLDALERVVPARLASVHYGRRLLGPIQARAPPSAA